MANVTLILFYCSCDVENFLLHKHDCSQIIRERLPNQPSRDGLVWNSAPGALLTLPHFSDSLANYPFYTDMYSSGPGDKFTAVIYCQLGSPVVSTSPLYRLVSNVARSSYIARVKSIFQYIYMILIYSADQIIYVTDIFTSVLSPTLMFHRNTLQ